MMALDEYLDAEGIKPASFEDILKEFTERFGPEFEKAEKDLDKRLEMDGPTKQGILDLYLHQARYGMLDSMHMLNYEQLRHNTGHIKKEIATAERILDLGCCDAFKTVYYAINYPDKEFVGIDMNPEVLAEAEKRVKRYGAKNISLICEDICNLKTWKPRQFDFILAINMLHEVAVPLLSYHHGQDFSMDFTTKLGAIDHILRIPGHLIISLNYSDETNEECVFSYELAPAAEDCSLNLVSRERRFFRKGDETEYNGLYHYTKSAGKKRKKAKPFTQSPFSHQ